jgi:ABC-type enterobactin transport system permease subunit
MTALETFTTASKQPLTTGRRPDMAAFFTGAVRAPLTGMVLVSEMTANATMLLPMLEACFTAMLVPALLRNAPIYDSLREVLVGREQARRNKIASGEELTQLKRSV